jgi:hypothetical protein
MPKLTHETHRIIINRLGANDIQNVIMVKRDQYLIMTENLRYVKTYMAKQEDMHTREIEKQVKKTKRVVTEYERAGQEQAAAFERELERRLNEQEAKFAKELAKKDEIINRKHAVMKDLERKISAFRDRPNAVSTGSNLY